MEDGKILIEGWRGEGYELSPEELLERVRDDSKSNYNWIAPASEITRVMMDEDFPDKIANKLKIMILRCFGELLLQKEQANGNPYDEMAVAYCYYTVGGKVGKRVKRLYRQSVLTNATKQFGLSLDNPRPFGATGQEWHLWYDTWIRNAMMHFNEYFGRDIVRWRGKIYQKFTEDVWLADKIGTFDGDKKKHAAWIRSLMESAS